MFQKTSGIEKFYASECYVTFFCRIILSHSTEKNRRGNLLYCVSENFRWRKSLWINGGGYQDFPSKFFCLTVPKMFVRETFSVSLISGVEKIHASEGYVTTFCRMFLSHSTELIHRGTLLICVPENFR